MAPLPQTASTLVFFVNGVKVIDDQVDPEWTLLYYLRNKLRLCGTKLGCGEGGCGACTVMVSKYDRTKKTINHLAVNACLAPVAAMHGLAVTTVEGIGSTKTQLHPVQERIAKAHGSQCGFCTPGIVMSMYSLLRSLPGKPSMKDLEIAFQGNLCRCTGYRPIIEGYKTFTEEWEQKQRLAMNGSCGMGKDCCRNKTNGETNGVNGCNGAVDVPEDEKLFNPSSFVPYDPTQEPIFPPELMVEEKYDKEYLLIEGPRVAWHRPTSFGDLLRLKKDHPQAKLINGNTEVGVEVKFKNFLYPVLVLPNQVPEMTSITKVSNGLKIGAAVTLTDMESAMNSLIKTEKMEKTGVFKAVVDMLHWFAGKQIRNVGAVGGNIMTGSPISDLNPIFMAANATLELMSEKSGRRNVMMDENFWTGYRRNIVNPDEVLVSITIPFTSDNQYFVAYKQAKRRDDDIAIVNAAFNLILDGNKVKSFKACYGGMAPTSKMALKTSANIVGKVWSNELINQIYSWLIEDFPLDPGVPGGMAQYRKSLVLSFFFKFYLEVCDNLVKKGVSVDIPLQYKSGKEQFHSKEPQSSQYFQVVNSTQEKSDMVGRPLVHQSAFKQATGEAIYCDDIPRLENESHLCFVTSTKPHAKILSVDASEALKLPGVLGFFSIKDMPDKSRNMSGPIKLDDKIFADGVVECQGQVIGVIVADDLITAQRAKKLVKIEYQDLSPVIITIEEAIKAKSYLPGNPKVIRKGDTEAAFKKAQHVIEGELHVGGQEHFYLETHAAVANPKKEDNEIEVYSSTQHPSELQHLASHMLGIPSNRITCKVKRLGGGFGGKESRACQLALPVVFAAHKLQRPVRMMLDRDEDMVISGQRHPFYGKYKAAFTSEGKITAVEISIYSNGGCSTDLSEAVMERAMFHFENAAYIPNVTCSGYVCKTNLPSNTAFRGFGGPQGMLIGENMIRQIADYLRKDPLEINQLNFYKEGDFTHFNQQLTHCTLQRCWTQCVRDAAYEQKRKEIDAFNKANRWKKRGLAVVPTKFGISFTTTFLNQAGALVLVYADGSVLISHGGAEMGQGLHTKMIQVASRALGIPPSEIHISETATDKVPNTSATAASAGSDLNGMAVLNACNIINERLKPIKAANPKGTWKDWVSAAYFGRVSLAASGFYQTPDIGYNMETNSGNAFNYFTYGVACAEVEIDCLTGDHLTLRTDIVMDLGESLNPAIDIGQIEGAFMQGYGLFTLEEMVVSPTGTMYSRGPGAYKIPGFADIPAEFNVSLLKGAPNPRAVYSSKAVGEPPLFLASSVFFAIKDAIQAARKDAGLTGWFTFHSPATAARIRMACSDEITKKFPEPPANSYTPWNVQL